MVIKKEPMSIILAVLCQAHYNSALMGSIVGARIFFQLDEDFEQNNNIVFTLQTVFDKSDGMNSASGITFDLLQVPRGPELDYADKFGMLKVDSSGKASFFPNNFTVLFMDGDMISGELQINYVMPSGNA